MTNHEPTEAEVQEAVRRYHQFLNNNSVYGISVNLTMAPESEEKQKTLEEFREMLDAGKEMTWSDVCKMIETLGDPRVSLMRVEKLVSKM